MTPAATISSAIASEQRFYEHCAELLGGEHAGERFPYRVRNRWNNRTPGRGRFPGYGLIRLFGSRVHLALHHPRHVHRWFDSTDEALKFLHRLQRSTNHA